MKSVYRFCTIQPFDGFVNESANPGRVTRAKSYIAAVILQLYFIVILCVGSSTAAEAKEGFVTATFGNAAYVQYPKTLKIEQELMHFDLSSLPNGAKIQRAILHFPFNSDWGGHSKQVGISNYRKHSGQQGGQSNCHQAQVVTRFAFFMIHTRI
jgi:hypothetical protein